MLYLGVLQRYPSSSERLSLEYELHRHGNVQAAVDDMITSEEFSLMRLPHLMASASTGWCGRYLFFMHVPKTAGTSVRMALTTSAGVPAITSYGHIGELPRDRLPLLSFWPLFIGHGHVDYFPEPHRGLTVFRESRSRYLSTYRQRQKRGESQHLPDPSRAQRQQLDLRSMPFETWVTQHPPGSSSAHFAAGMSKRQGFTGGNQSPEDGRARRFVRDAPLDEVRAAVERGFERIDYAAWAHDPDAIVAAISAATGDPAPVVERHNVFEAREYHRREPIGPDARAVLDDLRRLDAIAEQVAVDRGLIPALSDSEADAIFEQTVERLGFTLT
jgi:hypothetical protein